jgi:hypothetical protein
VGKIRQSYEEKKTFGKYLRLKEEKEKKEVTMGKF